MEVDEGTSCKGELGILSQVPDTELGHDKLQEQQGEAQGRRTSFLEGTMWVREKGTVE